MATTRLDFVDHKDVIRDVAYDFYGKRIATCSSDQIVKIYNSLADGSWKPVASWKTHCASVWRIAWAHPEFGQVLATCSSDRTINIYEEPIPKDSDTSGECVSWIKKSSMVDVRSSVTDVKFAPNFLGFKLAACSADGAVVIYECPDPMNLNIWNMASEIYDSFRKQCSSLSWNQDRSSRGMLAVGSSAPPSNSEPRLFIYECNGREWKRVEGISSVTDSSVHDVAFAPNVGRSSSMLAVASARKLHLFTLVDINARKIAERNLSKSYFKMNSIKITGQNESAIWRLSWNIIGTVLATSLEDGRIMLWKGNYLEDWRCVHIIPVSRERSIRKLGPAGSADHLEEGGRAVGQQDETESAAAAAAGSGAGLVGLTNISGPPSATFSSFLTQQSTKFVKKGVSKKSEHFPMY